MATIKEAIEVNVRFTILHLFLIRACMSVSHIVRSDAKMWYRNAKIMKQLFVHHNEANMSKTTDYQYDPLFKVCTCLLHETEAGNYKFGYGYL